MIAGVLRAALLCSMLVRVGAASAQAQPAENEAPGVEAHRLAVALLNDRQPRFAEFADEYAPVHIIGYLAQRCLTQEQASDVFDLYVSHALQDRLPDLFAALADLFAEYYTATELRAIFDGHSVTETRAEPLSEFYQALDLWSLRVAVEALGSVAVQQAPGFTRTPADERSWTAACRAASAITPPAAHVRPVHDSKAHDRVVPFLQSTFPHGSMSGPVFEYVTRPFTLAFNRAGRSEDDMYRVLRGGGEDPEHTHKPALDARLEEIVLNDFTDEQMQALLDAPEDDPNRWTRLNGERFFRDVDVAVFIWSGPLRVDLYRQNKTADRGARRVDVRGRYPMTGQVVTGWYANVARHPAIYGASDNCIGALRAVWHRGVVETHGTTRERVMFAGVLRAALLCTALFWPAAASAQVPRPEGMTRDQDAHRLAASFIREQGRLVTNFEVEYAPTYAIVQLAQRCLTQDQAADVFDRYLAPEFEARRPELVEPLADVLAQYYTVGELQALNDWQYKPVARPPDANPDFHRALYEWSLRVAVNALDRVAAQQSPGYVGTHAAERSWDAACQAVAAITPPAARIPPVHDASTQERVGPFLQSTFPTGANADAIATFVMTPFTAGFRRAGIVEDGFRFQIHIGAPIVEAHSAALDARLAQIVLNTFTDEQIQAELDSAHEGESRLTRSNAPRYFRDADVALLAWSGPVRAEIYEHNKAALDALGVSIAEGDIQ